MTTQTPSLVTMDMATDKASVGAFAEEVLTGTDWHLTSVRRRSSRLEPPDSYWTQFDIDIEKDEETRRLRLVAKGALNEAAWERLSGRLLDNGAGERCDPVNGLGYPVLCPETQHAYWFYPYDPTMPNLPDVAAASDAQRAAAQDLLDRTRAATAK